jgi:type VI secretion system protein VasD
MSVRGQIGLLADRALRMAAAVMLGVWVAGAMSGCSSKPPKAVTPVVSITLHAQGDVNPDGQGQPKPIVLHIYQLKSDAAFVNANYFALVDDEKRALGADLVSREEKELAPGEASSLQVPLAPDARFIGVVGEYRDLDHCVWQAIAPAPAAAPGKKGHAARLSIEAERARVTVSATP